MRGGDDRDRIARWRPIRAGILPIQRYNDLTNPIPFQIQPIFLNPLIVPLK